MHVGFIGLGNMGNGMAANLLKAGHAPAYATYGDLLARKSFEPAGFAATLGLKDVRLALQAAEELTVPLPLGSLLRDRFLTLIANGGGQLDWSAIATLAERDAGIGG